MNRKQKIAIVVGALVIVGLALFPPWYSEAINPDLRGVDGYPRVAHGLHYLGAPPPAGGAWYLPAAIDHELRNSLQIAVLALTVAAVIVLKDRKPAS